LGISASLAGTLPVLKSITDTLAFSTRIRSTVPAITRPSATVAASGASASDPGPNKAAKRASDRMPHTWATISARALGSDTPAERSSQRSAAPARAPASTAGKRSSS